jgi:translocation and assembly module TamB
MAPRQRARIALRIFSGVLLFLLILLAASPLWLPWILPTAAERFGLKYSAAERMGYSRLALRDVVFTNASVSLHAQRVEIPQAVPLLFKHLASKGFGSIVVSNWEVVSLSSAPSNKEPSSIPALYSQLKSNAMFVSEWVPDIELRDGSYRASNQVVQLPLVRLTPGTLRADLALPPRIDSAHAEWSFGSNNLGSDSLRLSVPAQSASGLWSIQNHSTNLEATGAVIGLSNSILTRILFGNTSSIPVIAEIRGTNLHIPARLAGLEGFDSIDGDVDVRWFTNQFKLSIALTAKPDAAHATDLAPFQIAASARGNLENFQVDELRISSDWLRAELSEPLQIGTADRVLEKAAALSLSVDLDKQTFIDARGKLEGRAVLHPAEGRIPDFDFSAKARDLALDDFPASNIELAGRLNWPWAFVDTLRAGMGDSIQLNGKAKVNVATRLVESGEFSLAGTVPTNLLPASARCESISLSAQFDGPVRAPVHRGEFSVRGLKLDNFNSLTAGGRWAGRERTVNSFEARISAADSSIEAHGALEWITQSIKLRLDQFQIHGLNGKNLSLIAPAEISWNRTGSNSLANIALTQLQGTGGALEISGSAAGTSRGALRISATNLTSDLVGGFLDHNLPDAAIHGLNLTAAWTNAPAVWTFSTDASVREKTGLDLHANVRLRGDDQGTAIDECAILSRTNAILVGAGKLPLLVEPGGTNFLRADAATPFDFHARTRPNADLWNWVARQFRIEIEEPQLEANVSGTFQRPEGLIEFSAAGVSLPKLTNFPAVKKITAHARFTRDAIDLQPLRFLVQDQPVEVTGSMPVPEKPHGGGKAWDWRKARLKLTANDAQIAAFAPLFPDLIRPEGTVSADLEFREGTMHGGIRLVSAATRPLPLLGSIQDINAGIGFEGERVVVGPLHALVSGERVRIAGEIDLAKSGKITGLPLFWLTLDGTNIAFVRQAGAILRGDLALSITNPADAEPVIGGAVELRQSYFLSDLKQLVPGHVRRPKERPPYFSIEKEPFADWRMNVRVRGIDFLTVRSPFFRGVVSANVDVTGPLKEPLAIGEVRISSGWVQFPFANLEVRQGFVTLGSDDPYRPQLFVNADAKTFGYDVKMEVTGTADTPIVQFTSTPGLSSEEILAMITSGQVPRSAFRFSNQERAQQVALFFGKSLLSKFGSDQPGADRLTIRSGEAISEQGKQTYSVEYRLDPKWSILVDYDRFSALNLGLKWKVYSK